MFDNEKNKILSKLDEYFPSFNKFKLIGEPYIVGGFLRSVILNREIKDLDIVILNGNLDNILKNINDNKLDYIINRFGGVKIKFNNKYVDIWSANNLIEAIEYDFEGLFFDIYNKKFLDIGFTQAIKVGKVTEINLKNRVEEYYKERENKLNKELLKMRNYIEKGL